jgi:hypothetical protein
VHVRPRAMVVDQVFRLFHGENDFLKKRILVDSVTCSGLSAAGWRHASGTLSLFCIFNFTLATTTANNTHHRRLWPSLAGIATGAGPRKYAWASKESVIVSTSANAHDSRVEEVHLKYRCQKAGEVPFSICYSTRARVRERVCFCVCVCLYMRVCVYAVKMQWVW